MSNFIFTETALPGVMTVDLRVYGDDRGHFMETYREDAFAEAGFGYRFVQDNQSGSGRGVLRGLHFQRRHPQAKLMRVLRGEIFDVAVDLRGGSAAYGRWTGTRLSEENRRQMLIPRGFAHGYLVLSDWAEIAYKCDDVYHPEDEGGIRWDDPDIGVAWPEGIPLILNARDRAFPTLRESGMVF